MALIWKTERRLAQPPAYEPGKWSLRRRTWATLAASLTVWALGLIQVVALIA
jgi:hypothetical protein